MSSPFFPYSNAFLPDSAFLRICFNCSRSLLRLIAYWFAIGWVHLPRPQKKWLLGPASCQNPTSKSRSGKMRATSRAFPSE
jgi:hypothetical protein